MMSVLLFLLFVWCCLRVVVDGESVVVLVVCVLLLAMFCVGVGGDSVIVRVMCVLLLFARWYWC